MKAPLFVVLPVYNDWKSAFALIKELDAQSVALGRPIQLIVVDDGSSESLDEFSPQTTFSLISSMTIVGLRRNYGHQKAIAIGLAYTVDARAELVAVMDADGEDRPSDLLPLVSAVEENGYGAMAFARRAKRTESIWFRAGLYCYRWLHWALTGRTVDVGNFSVLPGHLLTRLMADSNVWIHFAASAENSKLPMVKVPLDRGQRICGKSKMNVESLVLHGLSAISVYSDRVAVRVVVLVSGVAVVTVGIGFSIVLWRLLLGEPLPGWIALGAVGLAVLFCNLILIGLLFVLSFIQSRKINQVDILDEWRKHVGCLRQFYGNGTRPPSDPAFQFEEGDREGE